MVIRNVLVCAVFGSLALAAVGCSASQDDGSVDGNQAATDGTAMDIRVLSLDCNVDMDLTKVKAGSCDSPVSCFVNKRQAAGDQKVCIVYTSNTYGRQNEAYVFNTNTKYLSDHKSDGYLNAKLNRSAITSVPMTSVVYDIFGDDYYHFGQDRARATKCQNLYEMGSYCAPVDYFMYDARGVDPTVISFGGAAPTNG